MDQKSVPAIIPEVNPEATEFSPFSEREKEVLKYIDENGVRPISPTLASQMYELFLEGYSCSKIAQQNPPFREGDILYLRRKYTWDENKDRYAYELQVQIREKLIKQKLESIEFLTNMFAVTHKEHKDKVLRYLQTGKEEDKPDSWITGPAAYKGMLEAIQKLTGEDRVTTQNIKSESKVTVENVTPNAVISPELQSKMLKKLASTEVRLVKKRDNE